MELHLSKPGGHKEGPYTLEQVNRDLAEGKYTDTDFWAWHHGLTTWVPLYAISGVRSTPVSKTESPAAPEPQSIETPTTTATPEPEPVHAESTDVTEPEPVVATPAAVQPEPSDQPDEPELIETTAPAAVLESEPAAESTPVVASQPVEVAFPVLESQPAEVTIATTPEPEAAVATPAAVLESEPVAESTPVAASQPVEVAFPVLESQPAEVTIAATPEPEPAVATPVAVQSEPSDQPDQPELIETTAPADLVQPQPPTAHPASTRTGTASLDEMAAEADAVGEVHTGDTEVFSPGGDRNQPLTRAQVASGMPAQALEEIFVFTSGDGKAVMQSAVTDTVLENIVGEDLESVRHIRRHVIGRCSLGARLRREGAIPDAAWRAMAALKPGIIREAREGVYHTCVRTFAVEENQVVALFLFYNKDVAAALAAVNPAAFTLPAAVA